MLFAIK